MKRIGFVLMLLTLTTLASRAQNDDMYFVPKKSKDMPAMKRHSAYDRPATGTWTSTTAMAVSAARTNVSAMTLPQMT